MCKPLGPLLMIGRDEKENGICWRWVSTNSWILGLVRDRGRGGNHNNIARITEKERNSLAKTGQSKTSELWEISLGVCWRWVLWIWRRKSRADGLCPNIWCVCVSVCVSVCDEEDKFWMKGERRSHARETYDRSERAGCGLHQKVKKLRYTGLGYKPNKIFQFWIFCWDRVWRYDKVMSFELLFLSFEICSNQTPTVSVIESVH